LVSDKLPEWKWADRSRVGKCRAWRASSPWHSMCGATTNGSFDRRHGEATMRRLAPLGALISLLIAPAIAGADIVGVAFSGGVFRINETTGVGAAIGPSGFPTLNSLASNSAGTLYSTEDNGMTSQRLVTINPATGAG